MRLTALRVKSAFFAVGSCSEIACRVLNFGMPGSFVLRSGGVANSIPFANMGISTIAMPGSDGPVIITTFVNTDANGCFSVVGFSATPPFVRNVFLKKACSPWKCCCL